MSLQKHKRNRIYKSLLFNKKDFQFFFVFAVDDWNFYKQLLSDCELQLKREKSEFCVLQKLDQNFVLLGKHCKIFFFC